jgi:hypothetical protein
MIKLITIAAIATSVVVAEYKYHPIPGQYCGDEYESCPSGPCKGGVCCQTFVDNTCLKCALYDAEDNLNPKIKGGCNKCVKGYVPVDGRCVNMKTNRCSKKRCNQDLDKKCCWKCKNPCKEHLLCINGKCTGTNVPTSMPTL